MGAVLLLTLQIRGNIASQNVLDGPILHRLDGFLRSVLEHFQHLLSRHGVGSHSQDRISGQEHSLQGLLDVFRPRNKLEVERRLPAEFIPLREDHRRDDHGDNRNNGLSQNREWRRKFRLVQNPRHLLVPGLESGRIGFLHFFLGHVFGGIVQHGRNVLVGPPWCVAGDFGQIELLHLGFVEHVRERVRIFSGGRSHQALALFDRFLHGQRLVRGDFFRRSLFQSDRLRSFLDGVSVFANVIDVVGRSSIEVSHLFEFFCGIFVGSGLCGLLKGRSLDRTFLFFVPLGK
mmetsp:Transcript_16079/g.34847  ORF Transcript_16079/g.34847 Transcript_16079/m.34847 type:complete len:289 (-) Transcript_16079:181-1047(-)